MRLSRGFLAVMLLWINVSFAASVAGALSKGTTTSYDGFLFDVFEINVAEEKAFAVGMSSAKLDSYLVVVDPNGKIQGNDDGVLKGARKENSGDAALEFTSPVQGRWLIFATTLVRDEEGPYTLIVKGSSGLPIRQARPIREEITRVFSSRGVRDQELAIISAYEQLTLRSFRSELIDRLRRDSDEQNSRVQAAPAGLPQLEERLAQVTSAQAEVTRRLTVSNTYVGDLLAKERESIEGQIARAIRTRDEAVALSATLAVALQRLERFDMLDSELKHLESLLIDNPASASDEQRKRLLDLRTRRAVDGRALAELLIRSRMISPNSIAAMNGYTLYSELREVRGRQVSFAYMTRANLELDLDSSRSSFDAVSGRRAKLDRGETLDTSMWLPALLPWPPPAPSSQVILDRTALLGNDKARTMGELDNSIQVALTRAGYSGSTYWGVPGGFAFVTPLEQTDQHGVPLQADGRWNSRIVAMNEFSLAEYLRALLTAPVGFFRVILFVVSSETFASKDTRELLASVERWTRGGLNALPEVVAIRPFSKSHRVNVLVYEFVKQEDKQQPKAEVPGRLKAPDHLRAAKFSYFSRQ